ncbi:MAG: hypothetical protein WC974_08480 [Thermoplasmata archaeon]
MANLIGIILCILLAVLIAFFGYLLFEKKKGDAQIIEKLKAENEKLKSDNERLKILLRTK